jgi:SAM-dependent methyltransferase
VADRRIHRAAEVGFQLGAAEYERGRPDYPEDAVRTLGEELRLVPGSVVLDLAAGTGKLTRQLAPFGCTLVAVEPVEAMRATLAELLPDALVVAGKAEAIPLGDATMDAAVVAQAFHWFDPDAAFAELHRVLRPGGRLGIVYNVRDETVPLMREITRIIQRYRGDTPSHESGGWRETLDGTDRFTSPQKASFPHLHRMDPDGVVDRILSISFIAMLPPAEREAVTTEIRALLQSDPTTAGRDEIALPYGTDVYWSNRR